MATDRVDQAREGEGASPFRPPPVRTQSKASRAKMDWLLLVLSLVVFSVALALSVRGEEQVIVPVAGRPLPGLCGSKMMLGVDCPGCGLTRCFISLAHGVGNGALAAGETVRGEFSAAGARVRGAEYNLARAWHFNPGGIVLFAVMLAQIPLRSWKLWRIYRGAAADDRETQRPVSLSWGTWTLWIVLAALIGQWLVRMALKLVA
jgi:hypothetical protein